MIKKIGRLEFNNFCSEQDLELDQAWDIFNKFIQPINDALDEAVEVYHREDGRETKVWCSLRKSYGVDDTHKALLVNIEPIKQESCADLLAEAVELEIPIVSQDEDINKLRKINLWRKRAKAALERENEQD